MIILNKKIYYFLIFIALIISSSFFTKSAQGQQIDVTLTWSTDTYIPTSYQGKALPVKGSNIEVVATINSLGVNPEKLIYNWFINDHFQKEGSGANKQILKFNTISSTNEKNIIRLEINDYNKSFLGVFYLSIEISKPEIILYAKEKLSGFNSKIINEYEIKSNQEIQFIAKPYFFNIDNVNDLNYKWELDEEKIIENKEGNTNKLLLKIDKISQLVKKELKIIVENKKNYLQRAQRIIDIILIP